MQPIYVDDKQLKGYENANDHLKDEMKRLDFALYYQMQKQEEFNSSETYDEFKGMMMTANEAVHLLQNNEKENGEINQYENELRELEAHILNKRKKSKENQVFLPLDYLSDLFQLTRLEEQCIIICLAYEVDRKYEKLFGFIQDDMNYKYPTIDLVLQLTCDSFEDRIDAQAYFTKQSKLMKFFLEKIERDVHEHSILTTKLRLKERIVHFLIEADLTNANISSFSSLVYPNQPVDPLIIEQDIHEKIVAVSSNLKRNDSNVFKKLTYLFIGQEGVGKELQVKHFCKTFQYSLLIVDMEQLIKQKLPPSSLLEQVFHEAIIQQSVLCLTNVHKITGHSQGQQLEDELFKNVMQFSGVLFLLTEDTYFSMEKLKEKKVLKIKFALPEASARYYVWKTVSKGLPLDSSVDLELLANTFSFSVGQIKRAVEEAKLLAAWELTSNSTNIVLYQQHMLTACYQQIQHRLEQKAVKLSPKYTWEILVLPDDSIKIIKNACDQVKNKHKVFGEWGFEKKLSYGKGLTILFAGPPGTGKTMTAEVVANELGMEIYKIELSQLISKYIGETEQNLKIIFDEGKRSNAILFFDEADALFGKRSEVKDAKDKYANVEVAYLLQKMEEYSGVSILSTNLLENIDEAFLRRISFVVPFALPDVGQREAIWENLFPEDCPLDEDVDLSFLAEKLPISGGNIKNIVVSSAFLAAGQNRKVQMKDIIEAATLEMEKMGKILLKEDLGEYFYL